MIAHILPWLCLLFALPVLAVLSYIDLKIKLLPNKLVFTLALLGIAFHMNTKFLFCAPQDMILGALAGGGLLYLVRMAANRHYGRDTLGLGDVKLMAAGGLWLGLDHILLAVSLGAFAGVLHGLAHAALAKRRTGKKINLNHLSIPAGPGFIVGIIVIAAIRFHALPVLLPLW